MTANQIESVSSILRMYGPIKATKISTMLVWPPVKTYRVLAALEASGVAVLVKARSGVGAGARRMWAAA